MAEAIIQANDTLIPRERALRTLVFFGSATSFVVIGALLAGTLAYIFIGGGAFFSIGAVIGAVAGFIGFLAIKHLFVIQNNTITAFVTLDRLKSLLGKPDVNVIYGPGTHFSYPWEERFPENNIPLKEVAEEFNFMVVCKDGTLTVFASFRIRPDFSNLLPYLSGVGAAAQDFKALQIKFITQRLTQQTMQEAKDNIQGLNRDLEEEFVGMGQTPFELRFGVQTGDVTVSNMLMSDEAQRTRSALNEAAVVSEGTAILLGYKTIALMNRALKNSKVTQADIDRARREFRIISGNMDGAEVKRYEVDITGLTPEIASALSSLLNSPAARAFMPGTKGGKPQPQKGAQK